MTDASDIPEAADRRLASGAFSSGLSVPDFAACLQMGLDPVGLVQGFCAMKWSSAPSWSVVGSGMSQYAVAKGGYVQNYQCPHAVISNEHRSWGQNYEQTWVEEAWEQGFSSAYTRMMEQASAVGAHGVLGVADTVHHVSDTGVIEFHLWGTAVRLRDAAPPTTPAWSTYLAGQRLAKIFEAGFAPVAIVATVSSVRVWAYCMTELLMSGGVSMWATSTEPVEVDQIVSARTAARQIVRNSAHSRLHGDTLHGVDVIVSDREVGQGDFQTECQLRGNRVRRFKDFDPLAVPRPTVRLS